MMLDLAKKAIKVYREKGVKEVLRRTFHRIRCLNKRVRGPIIHFKIMGLKLRMYTPTYHDFLIIDHLVRTEHWLQRGLLRELKDGSVVWDVGANVGLYSCLLGKYGRNVTMVAFEPNPVAVERLKRNVSLNGLGNVQIIPLALLDVDGDVIFDIVWSDRCSLRGKVVIPSKDKQGNLITVKAIRGDTLVQKRLAPSPDIIKVDVEGGEIAVIKGMGVLLESCSLLFIEVHQSEGVDAASLEHMLVQAGFKVERFGRRAMRR